MCLSFILYFLSFTVFLFFLLFKKSLLSVMAAYVRNKLYIKIRGAPLFSSFENKPLCNILSNALLASNKEQYTFRAFLCKIFHSSVNVRAGCKIHFASKSCVILYWQRYCTALEQLASARLCGVEQRAPPIFSSAAITLGIGLHCSFFPVSISGSMR